MTTAGSRSARPCFSRSPRVLSLSLGPTGITLGSLPRAIAAMLGAPADADASREALVLFDIRLPRTLLAMFVGASLAVSGAMMQGLFRNPLADPTLIGIASGAAFAAVATIALGNGILGAHPAAARRLRAPVRRLPRRASR